MGDKKHYYNNGVVNRKFSDSDNIPTGFTLGFLQSARKPKEERLGKSEEQFVIEYYKSHSQQETLNKFCISKNLLRDICNKNNFSKTKYHTDNSMSYETIKQLVESGVSNDDIALSFGISKSSVCRILARFGIKRRSTNVPSREELSYKYIECNLTVKECSAFFGVSVKTIKTCLSRYGIRKTTENIRTFKESQIDIDSVRKFYIDEQNSWRDTVEKFNLSSRWLWDYSREHDWKHTKNLTKNSSPNKKFAELLLKNGLSFEQEFYLDGKRFDFKVGDTLIEINPSETHNIDWSPFGNHCGVDKNYHRDKTRVAVSNGYRCVNVWDWDSPDLIIKLLLKKNTLYARKCDIRDVPVEQEKDFLMQNHLQGYVKSDMAIGLYFNNELVSMMTFGKPRYNKNYNYELLRYCYNSNVIGGAERIFHHFLKHVGECSVVSYSDLSKFSGKIYESLGFTLVRENQPSLHWYRIRDAKHITNNLLLEHGYDKLFGTNHGIGTSNRDLMLDSDFLRVYDCGQATYKYINSGRE